jgi:hypothetical protein
MSDENNKSSNPMPPLGVSRNVLVGPAAPLAPQSALGGALDSPPRP